MGKGEDWEQVTQWPSLALISEWGTATRRFIKFDNLPKWRCSDVCAESQLNWITLRAALAYPRDSSDKESKRNAAPIITSPPELTSAPNAAGVGGDQADLPKFRWRCSCEGQLEGFKRIRFRPGSRIHLPKNSGCCPKIPVVAQKFRLLPKNSQFCSIYWAKPRHFSPDSP
jgi:hypothetical protein